MKLPISPSANRSAFTLIEILTVIAIIAILASLLLATSGFIQEKAGNSRAKVEIEALSSALEAYKLDMGAYPEGNGSDSSTKDLLDALVPVPGESNPLNSTGKVYLDINPKMLEGYSSKRSAQENRRSATRLVDPFGNPYHYEFDEEDDNKDRSGKGQFNLWSQGKKNSPDQNVWIKNW